MKYLIIEDERHNAERLKSLVEKLNGSACLLDVLQTVQDSVEWINTHPLPDLIFMDIRLSDGLSFEIFKKTNVQSPVIFTTAYDEYALQAFKVYGAAYLLKPIEKDELQEALNKVSHLQQKIEEKEANAIIEMLLNRKKTYRSRFMLHYRESYKVVPVEEIDYVVLELKIVYLKLVSGTSIAVPYTLEELEEQLDPTFFFRINRQYILHINSIESIHKYFNEKAKVILKRNAHAEVIVSRSRMSQFKLWLNK